MKIEEEIHQSAFKNEKSKGIVNLIYTASWLETKAKKFYSGFGLTPQQYNILRILRGQYPKAATVSLVQERMLDKMCDASRIIERLRIKELLDRAIASKDRRRVDVIINDGGLKMLSEIDLRMHEFEDSMSNLTDDELIALNILMDKLRS